jgi:hypothetical protein
MTDTFNIASPTQTTTPSKALVTLTPSAKDYLSSVATNGPVSLGVKGDTIELKGKIMDDA